MLRQSIFIPSPSQTDWKLPKHFACHSPETTPLHIQGQMDGLAQLPRFTTFDLYHQTVFLMGRVLTQGELDIRHLKNIVIKSCVSCDANFVTSIESSRFLTMLSRYDKTTVDKISTIIATPQPAVTYGRGPFVSAKVNAPGHKIQLWGEDKNECIENVVCCIWANQSKGPSSFQLDAKFCESIKDRVCGSKE